MNDLYTNFKTMVKEAVTESMQEIMKDVASPGKKLPEYLNLKIAAEYPGQTH